jgi:cobalamin-dependent methionine synthase I
MILIAENLTATSSKIATAVRDRDPRPLQLVAAAATRAGATYLDLNLGFGRCGRGDAIEFALQVLTECWGGGILADTVDPEVMDHVARSWPGKVVLNGYSGDKGRAPVLDVAAEHGLDVVVLMMSGGIPRSLEERLALAAQLAGDCEAHGVGLANLWFDPIVVPLGWMDGQSYNRDLIKILQELQVLFGGPVPTLLGVSNLTTGSAGKLRVPWMQQVFLAMAVGAGLTHAMVDIYNDGILRTNRALEVFEGARVFAPAEF